MNKKSLLMLGTLGGLVVVGALAYNYFGKPRKNSDGFYNASGTAKASPMRCTRCRMTNGGTYVPRWDSYPQCNFSAGERCLTNTGV